VAVLHWQQSNSITAAANKAANQPAEQPASQGVPLRCIALSPMKYGQKF
jgi:hypothetical protein